MTPSVPLPLVDVSDTCYPAQCCHAIRGSLGKEKKRVKAHPPTMTTRSSGFDTLHWTTGFLCPALISVSVPRIYTAPSFSKTSNLFKAFGAGASSTSPLPILKQAIQCPYRQRPFIHSLFLPGLLVIEQKLNTRLELLPPCQGQVIRPSGATTPSFIGAP